MSYICAAADVALGLIPPLLSSPDPSFTPLERPEHHDETDAIDMTTSLRFLGVGVLRVLACSFAGAAVSSVGGAGGGNRMRDPWAPMRRKGSAWSIPSGALAGAFYAVTIGGVFGEVMREYVFGENV